MTYDYEQFKEAFCTASAMHGVDPEFIRGFLKQAEDYARQWEVIIEPLASKDPNFCKQAFDELLAFQISVTPLQKQADMGEMGPQIMGLLGQLGHGAGSLFGQEAGSGLGGAIAGGGGGMLIGMLLSQLFNIPLPMAMLLGTVGGGALGYGLGGTQKGHEMMGVHPPADKPAPTAPTGPGQQQQVENQQHANQVGSGAPPAQMPPPGGATPPTQPPGHPPAPGAPPGPGAPLPGAQPPGAPMPGTPPVGGMPTVQPPGATQPLPKKP